MNGLSVAGMAIGASIALPELLRRGYDKVMATGVIQVGSSLGILGPPSVVLVLYGMIARQPIGQLWLAGKLRLLRAGVLLFLILFSMMGLFVMGYTSLVEDSAVGAETATIAALIKVRLTFKVIHTTLHKTLGISCMFMWIILGALCFGAVFDGLGAVKAIEGFFVDRMGLGPWEILIMMQLSYILMGMFLDDTAMLVIVAPLYVPLVGQLGFDLVWYGVLYTITCQIAYMTPPFGYNLFLMRAMAPPEISIGDIYRSIIPFVLVMIFGLALVTIFPQIALWLPNYVYGK